MGVIHTKPLLAAIVGSVVLLTGALSARAAPTIAPITLVPSIHSGWGVDKTTGGSVCEVASRDECQYGEQSSGAGGFRYLSSVAVDPRTGNAYVTDDSNNRIQELTATGAFIAMFGWDVNETANRRAMSSQAEKNFCTAASGDICAAGMEGTAVGQLAYPSSVAVAPDTGDVYVLEINTGDFRVDKYTPDGRFLWRIGKGVNVKTKDNICSEREVERRHMICGPGAESSSVSLEPGAFKFAPTDGNLLAVGGPGDLLYVGDEHRVQEFEADGRWKREILLTSLSAQPESHVVALALDRAGDLYLVYSLPVSASAPSGGESDVVHEFNPKGEQIAEFTVLPQRPNMKVGIDGLAIEPLGRLAVIGNEIGAIPVRRLGALYDADTGRQVGSYTGPSDNDGIAFNRDGDLYVAATDDQEVVAYVPMQVGELVASLLPCEVGRGEDSLAAVNCTLDGRLP